MTSIVRMFTIQCGKQNGTIGNLDSPECERRSFLSQHLSSQTHPWQREKKTNIHELTYVAYSFKLKIAFRLGLEGSVDSKRREVRPKK